MCRCGCVTLCRCWMTTRPWMRSRRGTTGGCRASWRRSNLRAPRRRGNSPADVDPVRLEAWVGSDDWYALDHRLRDEQPVEGVAVMHRELADLPRVVGTESEPG